MIIKISSNLTRPKSQAVSAIGFQCSKDNQQGCFYSPLKETDTQRGKHTKSHDSLVIHSSTCLLTTLTCQPQGGKLKNASYMTQSAGHRCPHSQAKVLSFPESRQWPQAHFGTLKWNASSCLAALANTPHSTANTLRVSLTHQQTNNLCLKIKTIGGVDYFPSHTNNFESNGIIKSPHDFECFLLHFKPLLNYLCPGA